METMEGVKFRCEQYEILVTARELFERAEIGTVFSDEEREWLKALIRTKGEHILKLIEEIEEESKWVKENSKTESKNPPALREQKEFHIDVYRTVRPPGSPVYPFTMKITDVILVKPQSSDEVITKFNSGDCDDKDDKE